ncbi:TonB-dependent receptor [Sphingosinicella sp. CPCC 101087]|uniref:TonB-dependent receptor n=1 Tax=Sphingosinicella sp. CPCC 101087 TaxID=2497754 RepID=UPI00101C07FC|nr:TonB-dependent receptor [Sphingosinicella sp. CPCC 101087]
MSKTFWLLSAGLAAIASPAHAQDEEPAATSTSGAENAAVDDQAAAGEQSIVITAQGRRQLLQDVPLAVQAVGGEQLQNSGANDIRQLNQLAPSLLVSSTGTEANGSARIRGIGTVGDNPGLESSVAVFIDGVYRSRSGIGLNELGEVERVEVLRGPQGTLFGRNASAGLIHIITRRPEFQFGGFAELTYGNYDNIRAAGGVTGPISEDLAFRIDAVYNRRDGFYEVVNPSGGTESDVNDRDRLFVRGQLLYEPNDSLSVRLIGDYTTRDESCCGAVYVETRESFDPTPGSPGDYEYATRENRIVTILRRMGGILPSEGDPYNRQLAVSPGRTFRNDTTDWGVSGQIDYDFGGATLTSITAYRGYSSEGAGDLDYGNVDILYRDDDGNAERRFRTFTQELRLQGSAFDGKLDWLVGGYFAKEDLRIVDNLKFGTQYGPFAACRALAGTGVEPSGLFPFLDPAQPACLSPTGRALVSGLVPGIPPAFGPATPILLTALDNLTNLRDLGDNGSIYNQDSRNWALFTHNIFNITDQWAVTVGLRYTREHKEFDASFNNNNTICPQQQALLGPLLANPALAATAGGIITLSCTGNSSSSLNALDLEDEFSEGEFTGTGILSYQPSPRELFYASYSRGYKAGGYNLDRSDLGTALFPRSNADAANLRFAPEVVNAFEVGMKLTRRNFTFNAAIFHQRFRDFQLNTFNGTVFIVQNINSCGTDLGGADRDPSGATGACDPDDVQSGVTSTGLELEAVLNPMPDLTFTAGYTYAKTEYEDNLIGSSEGEPLDPFLFLLPGQNMSNAPEHVATASMAWTPPIGSSGLSGLLYVDGRMTSDFNTGSDLFPEKEQDAFVVVNARVGIRGDGQRWAIELWAQNLFDTNYQQVAFNTPFQGANSRAQVAAFGAPNFATGTQIFTSFLAEPRTYGITGRFRF